MTKYLENQKEATRDRYGRLLVELGRRDDRVVVLDADLSKSTKTAEFAQEFPDRFFNMGIAEMNMMGTAAGLAAAGKIPFASTFAVFATGRAFEVIRQSICYAGLNVKIVATHAGLTVGEDGASHQALADVAIMRSLPGMSVMVPADAVQTEEVIRTAWAMDGPVYVRLGRAKVPTVFSAENPGESGRVHVLRAGKDVTLIGTGIMVAVCLEAAALLAEEGVEAMVVGVHVLKPLDVEGIVEAAAATGAVVTAEEHSIIGGLGGAVAECLGEHLPTPMVRVGVRDQFGRSGDPEQLLKAYGLSAQDVAAASTGILERKGKGHI